MKREDLKNEDWSRFLPVYKKALCQQRETKGAAEEEEAKARRVEREREDERKIHFPTSPAQTKRRYRHGDWRSVPGRQAAHAKGQTGAR